MKQPGKQVVWPSHLDSTKSRKEGRKLAKGLAVQAPRIDEMRDAAAKLSFEAELSPGKSRPSAWWEKGGYLVVPKSGTRTSILRSLASQIRNARAAKVNQEKTRK